MYVCVHTQNTVIANWCTAKCLPEVNVRGLIFYHDNTSFYPTKIAVEFFEQINIKGVEYTP